MEERYWVINRLLSARVLAAGELLEAANLADRKGALKGSQVLREEAGKLIDKGIDELSQGKVIYDIEKLRGFGG